MHQIITFIIIIASACSTSVTCAPLATLGMVVCATWKPTLKYCKTDKDNVKAMTLLLNIRVDIYKDCTLDVGFILTIYFDLLWFAIVMLSCALSISFI